MVALERTVVRARELTLEVRAPPEPVLATVDGDVVLRILENLVDNGVRYGHRLVVTVDATADEVVLGVEDDGPGVPAALRPRIFEKYLSVTPGAPQRRGMNRGLGLTFVQLAARAHGGDASVCESALGGARFEVRLPRVPVRRATVSPVRR